MATQQVTVSAFKTLCAEVADAIAAGNFATATSKYAQAEAVNAGLLIEAESAGERVKRRESLTGLKEALAMATSVVGRSADTSRLIRVGTRHSC